MNGTECYCDEEGASALQRMIADYSPQGIHFIDSGNYHYVTKFWTDKLATPFALLVFDHHPDMQPPLFEHILSCGSWVKDVLDTNANCKKVIIAVLQTVCCRKSQRNMATVFIFIVNLLWIRKQAGKRLPLSM